MNYRGAVLQSTDQKYLRNFHVSSKYSFCVLHHLLSDVPAFFECIWHTILSSLYRAI